MLWVGVGRGEQVSKWVEMRREGEREREREGERERERENERKQVVVDGGRWTVDGERWTGCRERRRRVI